MEKVFELDLCVSLAIDEGKILNIDLIVDTVLNDTKINYCCIKSHTRSSTVPSKAANIF